MLLTGEAGIGKTRLAIEFLGWAAAHGADVLQGRAFETGGQVPYQALVEALRSRVEQENAPEDLLSDTWLAELSRLLPELRDRYPDLPSPARDEATARIRCSHTAWDAPTQRPGDDSLSLGATSSHRLDVVSSRGRAWSRFHL